MLLLNSAVLPRCDTSAYYYKAAPHLIYNQLHEYVTLRISPGINAELTSCAVQFRIMETVWELVVLAFCCFSINFNIPVAAQTEASDSFQYTHQWYSKLLWDISKNNDKDVPPLQDGPVNVELTFSLQDIHFFDERNKIATIYAWFSQRWTDARLQWDPAAYNGTERITIDSDKVWLPDIVLMDSGTVIETVDADVLLSNTGQIGRYSVLKITRVCNMDFKFFPYDKQVCSLKFGSWHHNGGTINLIQSRSTVQLDTYLRPPVDFKIVLGTATRHEVNYECCPEPYIDITYRLHLERISSAYSVKLVLPAALTGFLILATFLLPSASYEKITLCGLIFIALLLQLIYLHDIVPASGDTILGDYFAFALFVDFFATIFAVVSYHVHVRSSSTKKSSNIMEINDGDLKPELQHNLKRGLRQYVDFVCFAVFGIVFVVGLGIILGRRE
ncbi:neuronal acetylcholine receptor subunit alpha-3-like isoform X2 [Amphiura filiformis]|uniref:neuronal acetylcholine receptor subunit alpha-3-like isoform X2 n=1 Tax=Amphiura filiformis TaxID=82378 RepID=UPI003B2106FD